MRRIPRAGLAALAALALAACNRPNLDETNGGYEPGMAPAPVVAGDADETVAHPPADQPAADHAEPAAHPDSAAH